MSPVNPTVNELDAWVSEDGTRISGRIFSSQEIYELERELIFKRCWQFVGCESQVRAPGDFVRSRLGEPGLLEPFKAPQEPVGQLSVSMVYQPALVRDRPAISQQGIGGGSGDRDRQTLVQCHGGNSHRSFVV